MNWTCKHCQQSNHQQQQYCRRCKYHWTEIEAWQPKKKRSQSRHHPRKEKTPKQQVAKSQEADPDLELTQLLSGKAPWITTTPQSRVPKPVTGLDEEPGLPPQPLLPPPPPAPHVVVKEDITEEELRVLKTLQDLSTMGVPMSEEQKQTMAALDSKRQQGVQTKELTHGHLNKLDKTKRQLKAMAGKIQVLDSEWAKFVQGITAKVANHAKMFVTCREQMVRAYQKKTQELHQAKQDAKVASDALLGKEDEMPVLPEAPKIDDQINSLQHAMAEVVPDTFAMEGSQIISDDDMDQELIRDGETNKEGVKPAPKKPAAFKGATSPTRVANQFLKK